MTRAISLLGFAAGMAAAVLGLELAAKAPAVAAPADELGPVAAKPLFRDPLYDGAADPIVIWNPQVKRWWMFYTNRRAKAPGLSGVTWVHGTRLGIAESADGGATWQYRGVANLELPPEFGGTNVTHWAPEVIADGGMFHMFVTVVPGIFEDWNHPRTIVHLTSTNLLDWGHPQPLKLASDRVIDPCILRLPDGTWRLWYNNERDHKSMYYADSRDLVTWEDRGKAVGDRGEGPKVFRWHDAYWMVIDTWRGLGVLRSDDALHWTRQQDNLVEQPGYGPDDEVKGGHPDVVVSGDRAFLFYFTHPGRRGADEKRDSYDQRRSSIQVVELEFKDGWLACDRDRPTHIRLMPADVSDASPIDAATMQRVYDEMKTPFKYGVVLKGETNEFVDCPSVFRSGRHWYLMYVAIKDKVGYETFLARSDDLLRWQKLGKILSFTKTGWDAWQADGGLSLVNPDWDGDHSLEKFEGKYWLSYIGGALQGYETDPLAIGIASTRNPVKAKEWNRLPENPVLSREQPDAREFEKKTLYKSTVIHDRTELLGAPFVMFYNAKVKNGYERIGMALSKDMVHWNRYGTNCVVANGEEKGKGISGDPQIVKLGNIWVMFYFGAGWKPKAFDTFACSYDLIHWTKWNGPHLIEPSEPWDKTYAHKPWLLKHDGIVYHFYCAVGGQGRVIALATSKDLHAAGTPATPAQSDAPAKQ